MNGKGCEWLNEVMGRTLMTGCVRVRESEREKKEHTRLVGVKRET